MWFYDFNAIFIFVCVYVLCCLCGVIDNNNNNDDDDANNKTNKYSILSATHIFTPVAIESVGTWHHQAV